MVSVRAVLLALAAFVMLAAPAAAQSRCTPSIQARLVAENGEIAPGGTVTVALEETIREGRHTFWQNPGDLGFPTALDWTLPPGWKASPIAWPYPGKRLPFSYVDAQGNTVDGMQYAYEGTTWMLVQITAPANAAPNTIVTLKAVDGGAVCGGLICQPKGLARCLQGAGPDIDLALPISVVADPAPPYATIVEQFNSARALIPVPSPWPVHFARQGQALDLFLAAPKLAPKEAAFFPFEQGVIEGSAEQELAAVKGGVVVRLTPGRKAPRALGGVLVLTSPDGSVQALSVNATPGAVPAARFGNEAHLGIILALVFAFVGGLILNLMPCVLPILAMKALAVARAGHGEAAREGLAYGAGAILSFVALGAAVLILRAGGEAVGWGFQLQESRVVAAFALLMFAVGLNLSGVFELPGITAGDSLAGRSGAVGAFFTGVLAVAVAAPCTAPFMATAIGYALTQGAISALGVFVSLGLGFAAPFVAVGLSPPLLRLLPKPGAWMLTFKQVLAFPMYGAAAWLVWVLAQQAGTIGLAAVLAAMIAFAFGAWAWDASRNAHAGWRGIGTAVACLGFVAAIAGVVVAQGEGTPAAANVPSGGLLHAEAYTPARLAELRKENRPIFIDATAAWCITCLVNEKVALSSPAVAEAFARTHTVYLVADWTKRDADITALLTANGRSGVPLYLFYKPGASDPDALPQVLTPDVVLSEIEAKN